MTGAPAFTGFSDRAVDFYRDLEVRNTRDFWSEHKAVYEAEVRDPMRALIAELEPEFGEGTVFRPHRDIRFSKDKSPYKTYQGAIAGPSPGIGYYVQIDGSGLTIGGGFHSHSTDQVERYRAAVDDEVTGPQLSEIVAQLRKTRFEIEGDRLKSRPRGFDADHPRLDLLRHKSLMAVKTVGTPRWLGGPRALDEVRGTWRQLVPLGEWIVAHVGSA